MTVAFLLLVRFGSLCMIIRFKTAFELAILTIVVYLDGVITIPCQSRLQRKHGTEVSLKFT